MQFIEFTNTILNISYHCASNKYLLAVSISGAGVGVAIMIVDGMMGKIEGTVWVTVGIDGHIVLVGATGFVIFLQSHGLLGLLRDMPLSVASSSV